MVRFKKLAAVLLSAVMLVCCFTVQASAKSPFANAQKINSLETFSYTFDSSNVVYFKFTLNDSGKIVFYCNDYSIRLGSTYISMSILDTNGHVIISKDRMTNYREKELNIYKKGTYILKLEKDYFDSYFNDMYYTFAPDHTPTISLALNAKVGDEFDFSALTSNYSGKVTMKTTDSKVADVDGNIVTCKKAGKAKIRAYMNNGDYAEITLIVKKK